MASNKILCFAAVILAFVAFAAALPAPDAPARVQDGAKGEKSDLEADGSYGLRYAYGGLWGGYGHGGYPYSYSSGYGYPYGYSYGYPYGYGWGASYGYPHYG